MDTFSPPPLVRNQNLVHPPTNTTNERYKAAAEWPNLASSQNAYIANIGDAENWLLSTPANCLHAAHISIALPTASAETEQQDDANK